RTCRAEPFARDPCVWPQPDVPLFEFLMESRETILEPGAFNRDPQAAEAQLEQLVIRQLFPGVFPAWHGASTRHDDSALRWCHGMLLATTAGSARGVPGALSRGSRNTLR